MHRRLLVLAALLAGVPPARAQVLHVADLNTTQIHALNRATTVVFLPGGMIEEHGPYLPVYTDGILSDRLTGELAASVVGRKPGWTAVIFPQIPLGASGSNELGGHFVFPGTYAVRPTTLRTVFMDLADELGAQGFRWIVVVHVHGAPLHNRALDEAADYFHDTYGGRMVHLWGLVPVLQGWGRALAQLPDTARHEDGVSLHAGMDETSLMLHLARQLVAPGYRDAPVVTGHTLQESFDLARVADWPGYLGSPRLASAELGARIWASFSTAARDQLLGVLNGADTVPVRRYADLLSGVPQYQGWMAAASTEEDRRSARQLHWLARHRERTAWRLPTSSGPFLVGTSAFALERASRTLVVTVWYPAADSAGLRRAPYLREAAALETMASFGRNPATTALRQGGVASHGWLDAPVVRTAGRVPVLLFSHGYLGMPSDYTALMEDLASHGYAVFSIAHTGETMAVTLPGGHVETLFGADNQLAALPLDVVREWSAEDSVAAAVTAASDSAAAVAPLRWYLARIPKSTAALERWVEDSRAVLDKVAGLARPGSGTRFADRLDVGRVGAVGHSMGGAASVAFCARDARCGAAVNLDGSPQYGDLIDRPSPRPVLMVYAAARPGRVGVNDPIYARGTRYWRAVLDAALHLNFGDWQFWEGPDRIAAALGPIAPAHATVIVSSLVREFFAAQLQGAPSPLLDGAATFPELTVRRVR